MAQVSDAAAAATTPPPPLRHRPQSAPPLLVRASPKPGPAARRALAVLASAEKRLFPKSAHASTLIRNAHARSVWSSEFGDTAFYVPWPAVLRHMLREPHVSDETRMRVLANPGPLQQALAFTCRRNATVSVVAMDAFCCLFPGLDTLDDLVSAFMDVAGLPCYAGRIGAGVAEAVLASTAQRTSPLSHGAIYLIRHSNTCLGRFAVTVYDIPSRVCYHMRNTGSRGQEVPLRTVLANVHARGIRPANLGV